MSAYVNKEHFTQGITLERLRPDDIANAETSRYQGDTDHPFRLSGNVRPSPLVDHDQCGRNRVNEVNTGELACFCARGKGHKAATEDTWYATSNNPSPSVRCMPDAIANNKRACNGNDARGHIQKSRCRRLVAEVPDQLGRVGCDDTAGYRNLFEH